MCGNLTVYGQVLRFLCIRRLPDDGVAEYAALPASVAYELNRAIIYDEWLPERLWQNLAEDLHHSCVISHIDQSGQPGVDEPNVHDHIQRFDRRRQRGERTDFMATTHTRCKGRYLVAHISGARGVVWEKAPDHN